MTFSIYLIVHVKLKECRVNSIKEGNMGLLCRQKHSRWHRSSKWCHFTDYESHGQNVCHLCHWTEVCHWMLIHFTHSLFRYWSTVDFYPSQRDAHKSYTSVVSLCPVPRRAKAAGPHLSPFLFQTLQQWPNATSHSKHQAASTPYQVSQVSRYLWWLD